MSPVVTVVLPVFNCPQYVGEAIQSILDQTCPDWELVIIDDGSEDESPQVVRRYTDPRIRFLRQTNQGLAATLNRGIGLARGRYIARQDQDDISSPDRLRKQIHFLDAHPSCALLGTWARIWRDRTPTDRVHRHPSDSPNLRFELLFNNPFVHSSVMMRKTALDRVGCYSIDPARQPPEDYELWSRIARAHDIANLPEVLHNYREIEGSMSRVGHSPFMKHLVTISAENIACASGGEVGDPQIINIAALTHGAQDQLIGEPNFKIMRSFLRNAVMHILPGQREQQHLLRRVDAHLSSLKSRYRDIKGRSAWQRKVMQALSGSKWFTR